MSPRRVRYELLLVLLCDIFLFTIRQIEKIKIPGLKGCKI